MFSTAPISHSRIRYPSSSDFSPMMRPAPPTWRKPAGETALPARTAARRESRSTLKTALASRAGAKIAAPPGQVRDRQAVEIEEALVDTVDLDARRLGGQDAHHPFRQIAIERVVRGQHRDIVAFDEALRLEQRDAHGDAERLGLLGAGDDAAIVVGQHDDGAAGERRLEHPLARGIEVVAIDQADRGHGPNARSACGCCG